MTEEASWEKLRIVGGCNRLLFGLAPEERLRRQLSGREGPVLVAHASAVLSDATISWLLDHPGILVTAPSGRPLALSVESSLLASAERALSGSCGEFPAQDALHIPPQFIRKLRRRNLLLARSLDDEPVAKVERLLFDNVYKGVTDLVTKYVWPLPAFGATRLLARLGISPNFVTSLGLVLTLLATWLFQQGALGAALTAAWLMTFLDTVDGKLARATVTSSPFGNLLDHATDYIHPPIWWVCLAYGLAIHEPGMRDIVWTSCWIILGSYVVGRLIEELFKRKLGFNQYLWRRFDSHFRLIVARRNIILLFITVGLLASASALAYLVCAAWSLTSVIIQAVRFGQGLVAARKEPLVCWLL